MSPIQNLLLLVALSITAFAALAKSPIADSELRHVDGRDGVNITADLDVKVATYVRTTSGGSITVSDFKVAGGVDVMLDDLNKAAAIIDLSANGILGGSAPAASSFAPNGDVVKLTMTENASLRPLNISVGSVTMGNAPEKSFGAISINQADLRGTRGYIWAR